MLYDLVFHLKPVYADTDLDLMLTDGRVREEIAGQDVVKSLVLKFRTQVYLEGDVIVEKGKISKGKTANKSMKNHVFMYLRAIFL